MTVESHIVSMSLSIESLNKLKDFRPLDLLTQQAQAVLRVAASRLVYFGIFRRPLVSCRGSSFKKSRDRTPRSSQERNAISIGPIWREELWTCRNGIQNTSKTLPQIYTSKDFKSAGTSFIQL